MDSRIVAGKYDAMPEETATWPAWCGIVDETRDYQLRLVVSGSSRPVVTGACRAGRRRRILHRTGQRHWHLASPDRSADPRPRSGHGWRRARECFHRIRNATSALCHEQPRKRSPGCGDAQRRSQTDTDATPVNDVTWSAARGLTAVDVTQAVPAHETDGVRRNRESRVSWRVSVTCRRLLSPVNGHTAGPGVGPRGHGDQHGHRHPRATGLALDTSGAPPAPTVDS